MAKDDKKICLLQLISQDPYIIWLSFMVHLCKMIISSGAFFIFSKMTQNDKKFCLSCLIYQEPYIMIVICGTQVYNDNISRHLFIFSKFWFFGLLGGSKGKTKAQNDKKNLSFALYISGTIHHMTLIYGAHM